MADIHVKINKFFISFDTNQHDYFYESRKIRHESRGIKDGDLCRVYSDRNEVVMAAYVTSRMMPGSAAVHHGAWFQTNGEEAEMNKFGLGMPDPSPCASCEPPYRATFLKGDIDGKYAVSYSIMTSGLTALFSSE